MAAFSGSASAPGTSASILVHSSSCTWTLAQRFHSSASRSSLMRGVTAVRTACSRTVKSSRSCLVGSGPIVPTTSLVSLRIRSASLSERFSAAARVSSSCTDDLQAVQIVLLGSQATFAMLAFVRIERLDGSFVARQQLRIDFAFARDRLPLLSQRVPLPIARFRSRRWRQPFSICVDDCGRLLQQLSCGQAALMTTLSGAAGSVEALLKLGRPGLRHRRHAFPGRPRGGESIDQIVAIQAFDISAHRCSIGLLARQCLRLAFRFGTRGVVGSQRLANAIGQLLEARDQRRAALRRPRAVRPTRRAARHRSGARL